MEHELPKDNHAEKWRLLIEGDEKSWNDLYDWGPAYTRRRMGKDASDLHVELVFSRAFDFFYIQIIHLQKMDWLRAPEATFKTVIKYKCYEFWRENTKNPGTMSLDDFRERLDIQEDEEAILAELERDASLDTCFPKLAPNCRQALTLLYYEKKTYQEIASEMGYTAGYTKQKIFRCMTRLRECMKGKMTPNDPK